MQYDFNYEVPDNFHDKLVQFLQQNGKNGIALVLQHCKSDYEDKVFAYYAGLKGDNWNKKALDFTFEGSESNINALKTKTPELKESIQKLLKPNTSGYLVREIDFIISDYDFKIVLPEEQ